jgi:hypothetical protein
MVFTSVRKSLPEVPPLLHVSKNGKTHCITNVACRQQFTSGIQHPWQCDSLCGNTSGCSFWTFVASKPGSGQAPYNCFARADPFRGQNGWTGGPPALDWFRHAMQNCIHVMMCNGGDDVRYLQLTGSSHYWHVMHTLAAAMSPSVTSQLSCL